MWRASGLCTRRRACRTTGVLATAVLVTLGPASVGRALAHGPALAPAVPQVPTLGDSAERSNGRPVSDDAPASPAHLDHIWYDGRGALFAASTREVHRLSLEASPISWPADMEHAVDGDGFAGRSALVAFAAADGRMLAFDGGGWRAEQLDLGDGETVLAVAIDGSGVVYATTKAAVHVWDRDRVRSHPLPEGARGRVRGSTVSAGGRLYLTGAGALLLRFDGKLFEEIIVAGASEQAAAMDWHDAWLSADGHRLYVRAGADRVLVVDTRDGGAVELRLPAGNGQSSTSGAGAPISGSSLASGDLVVTSMGARVFALDGRRFLVLGEVPGGAAVTDLAVAMDEGRTYALAEGSLHALPLEPAADAEPAEPVSADESKRLDQIWRRDRRRDRRGPYPSDALYVPSIDLRVGPSFTVAPRGEAPATSFALDAGVGVVIAPHATRPDPIFWVWPQVGYALDSHPRYGHHALYAATGLGFGNSLVAGYYTPGLLLGAGRRGGDGSAVPFMGGLRHGISIQALWGAVGLELRHQVQWIGSRSEQDLGVMFSLNLAPLVWLPIAANLR